MEGALGEGKGRAAEAETEGKGEAAREEATAEMVGAAAMGAGPR